MNKEEILAKSRREENDEMEQHMESEGLRKGYAIFCVIFIVVTLVALLTGQTIEVYLAMFFAFTASRFKESYRVTQNRRTLLGSELAAAACICSLIAFVLSSVLPFFR